MKFGLFAISYGMCAAGGGAAGGGAAGGQAIAPWTGLGVLAAYAGLAVIAGALFFSRRDA